MYPSMMSRAGEVEIEPYYCLPVGTNGVLTAQMAAAMAAQSQAAQGNPGVGVNVGGVAWSQPTSPTPSPAAHSTQRQVHRCYRPPMEPHRPQDSWVLAGSRWWCNGRASADISQEE